MIMLDICARIKKVEIYLNDEKVQVLKALEMNCEEKFSAGLEDVIEIRSTASLFK